MADITGKIYQMKNADGTENRFPRTVIEAVLGLSSYLQNQFSSLADIYMPIEGIYEALTGQEFVFRKSPNTIKAKSLTIDRIKGKTLAWNQLVSYVEPLVTGDTTNLRCTKEADGRYKIVLSSTVTQLSNINFGNIATNGILSGHAYYFAIGASSNLVPYIGYNSQQGVWWQNQPGGSISNNIIRTYDTTRDFYNTLYVGSNLPAGTYYFLPISIDLTLMFGAGNEPSSVEEFEALYPDAHCPYNSGTLISNDAEAVETTGVNQWDEELELGQIVDGSPAPSSTRFRSKNFCKCIGSAAYYLHGSGYGTGVDISWYDSGQNYITRSPSSWGAIITAPSAAAYFKICVWAGTTYNHDICINLSDPDKNGTYEPYWKITQNLGLNEFKVKDSQGNITTITGGLKSAGSVYDEIVGNKLIKRVGEVDLGNLDWDYASNVLSMYAPLPLCKMPANYDTPPNGINAKYIGISWATLANNYTEVDKCFSFVANSIRVRDSAYQPSDISIFKADLQGVMLYYELATPIEYDLEEPLIYTTKAGTTEERISPNPDGLSAPFCCDMTYSANENNDAGNAQYAATAGRLLNTRKIWGQDFNGSEDVNGNLVSNGILQGTQLKSTVQTGTAPLVVSSTTTVANLVAEKASKLLTVRTIWGQSFDGSGDISGAISNITTISASGLATIAGGIALGTSTNAQAAKMVWDETNEAWHLQGNLYADGFLTAGGINNGNDTATLIFGQNLSSSGETFSISAGLYDAPNDEYFTVPSSDSAQDLDTGHILATKADIDTINARIQLIVDNNALFEPTE